MQNSKGYYNKVQPTSYYYCSGMKCWTAGVYIRLAVYIRMCCWHVLPMLYMIPPCAPVSSHSSKQPVGLNGISLCVCVCTLQ